MQVICPSCTKRGYLQRASARCYRIRHYVCSTFTGSKFRYCHVSYEWAMQQIAIEEENEREYRRHLMNGDNID